MNKVTKLAISLLVFFNNYIIINFYVVPNLYKDVGSSYIYFFIIVIILTGLLYLIFPKKLKYSLLDEIKASKIKWFLSIYLSLIAILIVTMSSVCLSAFFYRKFIPFYFLIAFLLFSNMIRKFSFEALGNSTLLFFLLILFVIVYFLITKSNNIEIQYIKTLRLNNKIFFYLIYAIFISIDNVIFVFITSFSKVRSLKWILIPNIVFMLLELTEGLILISLFGDSLRGYKSFGFLLYNISPRILFIDNLDFIYIYFITICSVVKLVFAEKLVCYLHNKKNYFSFNILLISLTSFVVLYAWDLFEEYLSYFIGGLTVLLIIITIYIWRKLNVTNKRTDK